MYKLVVIAGKLRGEEFILEEGENIVGRGDECQVQLLIDGISKKHLSITVTGDVAYIQDLDSANGTFVNGKIIKSITAKTGDKIALPDTIIQVVFVKEKKIIIKRMAHAGDHDDEEESLYLNGGTPPDPLPGKIVHLFKYKFMRFVYSINKEYEWRVLFAILLTAFVFITISLTIFPILQDSKRLLLWETAKRGGHYADEIARMNARALEQNQLEQVNTAFLDNEPGVSSYELFDLEGRIVRPLGKLNEYISDPFSIQAREWAASTTNKGNNVKKKVLGDGEIGIAQRIMAYNAKVGIFEAVGVIAIRFAPKSLAVEATKNSKAYLEALTTSAIVAIIFFGVIYFLTVRPIEEMRFQMEEALRGKRRNIEGNHLMGELIPLRNSINSVLQRFREMQNDGQDGDLGSEEEDGPYVATLIEFMQGSNTAVLILNSEKNVSNMNLEAEDLLGFRQSNSEGMSLLDVAKEKGFAATVLELCDMSANNSGTSQNGDYELMGSQHEIYVNSLAGRDGFAKAFYVTFVKDSG